MSKQRLEVLLGVGRLVSGHPMDRQTVTDKLGQPLIGQDGHPVTKAHCGIAIPKVPGQDWKITQWGQIFVQAANTGYPNGETRSATFAWKVTDGDSDIPNKKGKKPCDREGYPGHWVVHCTTRLNVRCFHRGKYDPIQQIQRKEEIKRGDYCRISVSVVDNVPSESPGIYVNPEMFELYQAGVEIVGGDGPSAADVFGTSEGQLPSGALVDTNVQTSPNVPPAPPVQQAAAVPPPPVQQTSVVAPPPPPATDLVQPQVVPPPVEKRYTYGGVTKTEAEWEATPGWAGGLIKQHGQPA